MPTALDELRSATNEIHRRLETSPCVGAVLDGYLSGSGERAAARFQGFIEVLNAHVREPEPIRRAIRGAVATFEAFESWLGNADQFGTRWAAAVRASISEAQLRVSRAQVRSATIGAS
jgi:heme oxygenase